MMIRSITIKRIVGAICILSFLLISVPVRSQIKFGVKGGVNLSSISFKDLPDIKNRTGFHIGPMMEASLPATGLGLDAAILFSQRSAEVNNRTFRSNYLEVPVNLKLKFGLPLVKFYGAAGPFIGFKVGGTDLEGQSENLVKQIKSKSFSAGLNFGAGVELFSHLQVGVNYALGLTENYSVMKFDSDAFKNGKNRGWSISAAFLF